ncbi:MAG TPA: helix-turn-helix transcriptional regulator [Novimethylophilus sp.]|uniref:helix-turn-helix transcriptional regulator n=1 Tax=Novimethylophilus sp. TaxID=2137426 RepID=UPI002F3F7701
MNTLELLYEAKRKTGIRSDYALAQKLEIPRQRITDYKNGNRQPDTYTLTRLAIVLERDPMGLIAEFEASNEKNQTRKDFWKGFLLRQNLKVIAMLVLALSYGVFYDPEAMADTNNASLYNKPLLHSVSLCEIRGGNS